MLEALRRRAAAPWHARAVLHVAPNGLCLSATGPGQHRVAADATLGEQSGADDASLVQALALLLKEGAVKLGRSVVDVSLDDRLVRIFSVTPPMGARGLGDLRAAAHRRFGLLYGDAPDNRWCLDAAWRSTGSFIAVAMPQAFRNTLLSALSATHWPVRSIAPVFARELHARRRALGRPGTWLVVHGEAGDAVTVGVRLPDGDRVRSTTMPITTWTEAGALGAWIEGEALLLDVDPPRTLMLAGAEGSAVVDETVAREIDGIAILRNTTAAVTPRIRGRTR